MAKKCKHLYCETKDKPPFDWMGYLERQHKRMAHSASNQVMAMARSWVTCACGNQCRIIPREADEPYLGTPKDKPLRDLGVEFNDHVSSADWLLAIGTLALIERRSAILIERELAKRAKHR